MLNTMSKPAVVNLFLANSDPFPILRMLGVPRALPFAVLNPALRTMPRQLVFQIRA